MERIFSTMTLNATQTQAVFKCFTLHIKGKCMTCVKFEQFNTSTHHDYILKTKQNIKLSKMRL